MTGWMRWLIAIACLVGSPASSPAWAQAPQRVVTVNLCLDQIALHYSLRSPLSAHFGGNIRVRFIQLRSTEVLPLCRTIGLE